MPIDERRWVLAVNSASILQVHPVGKAFMDEAEDSCLQRADYHRRLHDNVPARQRY
jgi:hypothetical protein